jgi:hypothetical protein
MAWEVFTGLGIDAAIGLGMTAGSAAGSICALRVVLRRAESHVGGRIVLSLVARVQGIYLSYCSTSVAQLECKVVVLSRWSLGVLC